MQAKGFICNPLSSIHLVVAVGMFNLAEQSTYAGCWLLDSLGTSSLASNRIDTNNHEQLGAHNTVGCSAPFLLLVAFFAISERKKLAWPREWRATLQAKLEFELWGQIWVRAKKARLFSIDKQQPFFACRARKPREQRRPARATRATGATGRRRLQLKGCAALFT